MAGDQSTSLSGAGTTYATQAASDAYYTNITIYAFSASGWVSQTWGQYQTDSHSTTPSTDPLPHDVITAGAYDDVLMIVGPIGAGFVDYRFYTWEEFYGSAGPGGLSVTIVHAETTNTQFDVEQTLGGESGDAYRIVNYASRSNAITFGTPFYHSIRSQSYMPGDNGAFGTRLRTAVSFTELVVRDSSGNVISNGFTVMSHSGEYFPVTPPIIDAVNDDALLTIRWHGYTGHTYSVDTTTNVLGDAWTALSNAIDGTGTTNAITTLMGDSPHYFRIRKE